MPTIVFNQDHIGESHVCWDVVSSFKFFSLYEIVVKTYPHPDAPESMTIQQHERKFIGDFKRDTKKASNLILLEAIQCSLDRDHHQGLFKG